MTPDLIYTAIVTTCVLVLWVHCGIVWFDAWLVRQTAPLFHRAFFVVTSVIIIAACAHILS